jgi:hypothetical protein
MTEKLRLRRHIELSTVEVTELLKQTTTLAALALQSSLLMAKLSSKLGDVRCEIQQLTQRQVNWSALDSARTSAAQLPGTGTSTHRMADEEASTPAAPRRSPSGLSSAPYITPDEGSENYDLMEGLEYYGVSC